VKSVGVNNIVEEEFNIFFLINALVSLNKEIQAVKLCSIKIFQLLNGSVS